MATKGDCITAIRRFLEETETSGGFWHQDELISYIDYATLELWQYWTNNPTDNNPWLIQHSIANGTANGRTDLRFGHEIITTNIGVTDRILDIYSDSNTVIPRWKVVRAESGTDIVQFDSALPNEKIWLLAIHKPKLLRDIAGSADSDALDVPTGWTQWLVKRAVTFAFQKSGQDTRDLRADTDKMLQTLAAGFRVQEGNN